jgi:hypothetical protein
VHIKAENFRKKLVGEERDGKLAHGSLPGLTILDSIPLGETYKICTVAIWQWTSNIVQKPAVDIDVVLGKIAISELF